MKKIQPNNEYAALKTLHFSEIITHDFSFRKNLKGVVFGNFGVNNYGDEAILAGQLKELKKIKHCTTSVISGSPYTVKRTKKSKTVHMYNMATVIQKIKQADFIIIGGGGLFCKNDTGIKGFLFQMYSLLIILLPLLFNKKVYVLGIGIYSNMNKILAFLTIQLFKKISFITVRDFHSLTFIRKSIPHAKLYKDNSFLMELSDKKTTAIDTYFKKRMRIKRHNVGISIIKPASETGTKKMIDILAAFIEENSHNTDFWIYPLDTNERYYNDTLFAKEIIKKIGKNVTFHFVPTTWHPKRFFSSFYLMDYFISMRLHSSIFCYRTQKKFFAISYDKKCASFLKSIRYPFTTAEKISAKSLTHHYALVKNGYDLRNVVKKPQKTRRFSRKITTSFVPATYAY